MIRRLQESLEINTILRVSAKIKMNPKVFLNNS